MDTQTLETLPFPGLLCTLHNSMLDICGRAQLVARTLPSMLGH